MVLGCCFFSPSPSLSAITKSRCKRPTGGGCWRCVPAESGWNGGKKKWFTLVVVAPKADFHRRVSRGGDIKYPALNYEIAWIMNVALKCSPLPPWWRNNLRWIHQSASCQRSGLPSEVAVLSSGTRFSCCTGRLVKTDGKLDSWVCLSGLPRGLLFSQFSKTTSLVQYVFYIFGFYGT